MQVENLSRIEKELYFKVWRQKNGIARILLDVDDTICATGEIFDRQFGACSTFLEEAAPRLSRGEWRKEIEATNNRLFESQGVNPDKMRTIMAEIGKKYTLGPGVQRLGADILSQIYEIKPRFLEGSEEALTFLKKTDTVVGALTHANTAWSWRKYNWLRLDRFMDWDEVYVVDENGHKNEAAWQGGCDYFKVRPEQVAMAGDSPRSDINPARAIGIRHCFLIENEFRWSIHNQAVDKEVRVLPDLRGFIGLGAECLSYRVGL